MKNHRRKRLAICLLFTGCLLLAHSGCQVIEGGHPSSDKDIQYYPPGPEFKQQREEAAKKAFQTDLEAQQAGQ